MGALFPFLENQRARAVGAQGRLFCLCLLLFGLAASPSAQGANPRAETPRELRLSLHLVDLPEAGPARARKVRAALRRANEALAPFGITVRIAAVHHEPLSYRRVRTARDRARIARRSHRDGTIHVWWVDEVRLSSALRGRRAHRGTQPGQSVSGVHWRYRGTDQGLRRREFIAVSTRAPETTLAHEIGHVLGLGHSRSPDNLMCGCRRGSNLGFTAGQGARLNSGLRRWAARQRRSRAAR